MKTQTLLFGAGQGSRIYMENNLETREFIGFLDNDKSKHGEIFEGLPIHHPSFINELEFDEVVITTQWALEVQHQLLDELHISKDKVILPEKNQLKKITPFENPKTRNLARDIVKTICRKAIDGNVPIVVDFGTLLGLIRDQDIIEWDDDVDFAAPIDSLESVERLFTDFVSEVNLGVDWILEKVTDSQNDISGFLLKFSDPTTTMVEFTSSISFRKNVAEKSIHMPSLGMWFSPQIHFSGVDTIEWQGNLIAVPINYEAYLTFQYGDWKTPKKNIQLSDYANIQSVDFADIQKAKFQAKQINQTKEEKRK
ncbi:LicD family protein [Aliiglaciecola sp.]|nr:LicD family protein [Aliiglaciecola sp.]